MPAWTKEEEGGSALRRRAAKASRDKAVEAQRKNKLENAQLSLFNAMVDRKKVHAIVALNREKDELRAGMRRMRKTTGFCKQGLPPSGPEDKAHQKSPYFQTLGHVSEKRLQKWKNEEKALQRILISEEDLRPPWEKDSVELAEETLSHLLNLLGYDEDEAKEMLISLKENKDKKEDGSVSEGSVQSHETAEEKQTTNKRRGYLRSASASSFGAMSTVSEPCGRIDVFECLREGMDGNSNPEIAVNQSRQRPFQPKGLASASADDFSQSSRDSSFSLRDWEKLMTERYKKNLVNPPERHEGPGESTDKTSLKNRPRSAPAKTGNALKRRALLSRRRQRSGQEAAGGKGKSLSGATSITDLREGNTGGAVDAKVRGTDVTDLPPRPPPAPRRHRPHTALPPRAVEATRGLVVDNSRPATAYRKAPQPPKSQPKATYGSHDESDGTTSQNSAIESIQRANRLKQNQTKPQNSRVKLQQTHLSTPDLTSCTKEDELNAIEEEPEEVPVTLRRNRKVSVFTKGPALPVGRRRYSVTHTEAASCRSNQTSGDNSGRFRRSMSLNPDSLSHATPVHKEPPQGDASHSRTAFRARRHTVAALGDIVDDDTGSEGEDESQSKENDLRAQWRRNLLKDAPPGFAGRDDKIRLAVSKSQLRRDMEQMVVEHESDIRETIRKEHMRRMRKRMDIVLTLQKLAKKPEVEEPEVTETPAKGSGGPKLVTQVGTIMQMLKLKKMAQQVRSKRASNGPSDKVNGQIQNEAKA